MSISPVRRFVPVARSRRLPFYPGLPVAVIRLRGVRYPASAGSRANFCAVRGWFAGGRWSSGL